MLTTASAPLFSQPISESGLTGWYYPARNFEVEPIERIDPQVDFDWRGDSPMEGIEPNQFQVRWRGSVTPRYTERLIIKTRTDDGVRVWLNHELIIDNWTNHGATDDYGALDLEAGVAYPILVEYYEQGGNALMSLSWESAQLPSEPIPSDALTPWRPDDPMPSSFGARFNRSQASEGSVITLSVYRLGLLDAPMQVQLNWEGDGLYRLTNRRDSLQIPMHTSATTLQLRVIDDDLYQPRQEVRLTAQILDESGRPLPDATTTVTLTLRDDQPTPTDPRYIVTGRVDAPLSSEIIVRATPQILNVDDVREVREEVLTVDDRYALSLPQGPYFISARLKINDLWIDAMTADGAEEIWVELPPDVLSLNWINPQAPSMGGDTAGGDTAGGDTAGGDTAGGDTAGGDTAGGDNAGGDISNGEGMGGDNAGGQINGKSGEEGARSSNDSCQSAQSEPSQLIFWLSLCLLLRRARSRAVTSSSTMHTSP